MEDLTVFVSSFDEALVYRKNNVKNAESALLGSKVTPLFAWLEEQWTLWGDDRTIITPMQRSALVSRLLSRQNTFPCSDGMIRLFSRYLYEVCGSSLLDKALVNKGNYAEVTQNVLTLIEEYQAELNRNHVIESGQVLVLLPKEVFSGKYSKSEGFDAPYFLDAFFGEKWSELKNNSIIQNTLELEVKAFGGPEVPEFLFPSGSSAQGALLVERMEEWFAKDGFGSTIFIASNNPLSLFDELRDFFVQNSLCAAVYGSTTFSQTAFGKSYLALVDFFDTHSYDSLSDYLHNSFSGVSEFNAYQINALLRSEKRFDQDEILNTVRKYAPHFSYAEELFLDVDASVVLDYFKEIAVNIFCGNPAQLQVELSAINALRSLYEAVRSVSGSLQDISYLAKTLVFDVNKQVGSGFQQVVIGEYSQINELMPNSFDTVLLCDLDNNSFPSTIWYDPFLSCNEDLGVAFSNSYLSYNRLLINRAQDVAIRRIVCEQTLMNESGEESYPVFFFDEFMEHYRCSEKEYQYPSCDLDVRACKVYRRGEELLEDNLSKNKTLRINSDSAEFKSVRFVKEFEKGLSKKIANDKLILFRESKQTVSPLRSVSPSDIEAYLACPYRWFIERRVNPQTLDFSCGPLEQGTFVHELFADFYRELNDELGFKRITSSNLSESQVLFSDLFDAKLLEQREDNSAHYLLETKSDKVEGTRLKEKLLKSLEYQSTFIPKYIPFVHEESLNKEHDVLYAGKNLVGRVDRIDVNEEERTFVVVDYKGKISGFEAGYNPDKEDSFILPRKVQALIYAQALRKQLSGLKCQGALYFSYLSLQEKGCVAGSFSPNLVDLQTHIKEKSKVNMNFESYLDLVEKELTPYIDRLFAGDIEPNPRDNMSCKYCPVVHCEKRL